MESEELRESEFIDCAVSRLRLSSREIVILRIFFQPRLRFAIRKEEEKEDEVEIE